VRGRCVPCKVIGVSPARVRWCERTHTDVLVYNTKHTVSAVSTQNTF